jgi:hypothetical protein
MLALHDYDHRVTTAKVTERTSLSVMYVFADNVDARTGSEPTCQARLLFFTWIVTDRSNATSPI